MDAAVTAERSRDVFPTLFVVVSPNSCATFVAELVDATVDCVRRAGFVCALAMSVSSDPDWVAVTDKGVVGLLGMGDAVELTAGFCLLLFFCVV